MSVELEYDVLTNMIDEVVKVYDQQRTMMVLADSPCEHEIKFCEGLILVIAELRYSVQIAEAGRVLAWFKPMYESVISRSFK